MRGMDPRGYLLSNFRAGDVQHYFVATEQRYGGKDKFVPALNVGPRHKDVSCAYLSTTP
jgi:hypothetical protein